MDVLVDFPTSPRVIDLLLGRYDDPEDSFQIRLPDDLDLSFRVIRGRRSLVSLRNAAHRFAESVTELNCPPEMRPYMSSDSETLVWVYFLGALSLDGNASDFLKLQHLAPVVFDHILERVQARLGGEVELAEAVEVDEAKKDSAPTSLGATD